MIWERLLPSSGTAQAKKKKTLAISINNTSKFI